jgi:ATP adenylyltransferase
MNAYPYNPGHLLVCPYAHVADPENLSEEVHAEMMRLTIKWKKRLGEVVQAQGFNLGINLGSIAGAGIAEHLHAHIVPRWQGDTNFMTTVSETRVLSQSLSELYEKLMGE